MSNTFNIAITPSPSDQAPCPALNHRVQANERFRTRVGSPEFRISPVKKGSCAMQAGEASGSQVVDPEGWQAKLLKEHIEA